MLTRAHSGALEAIRARWLTRRKQALLELCEEIRKSFGAAELPCLFLKGLYLGERFYGDVHRRHQYDVDVLVRPADFEAALNVHAQLGFDVTTARAASRWPAGCGRSGPAAGSERRKPSPCGARTA